MLEDNKTETWQTMLQMNCSPIGLIQLIYCHVSWGTHSKRSGWSSLFRCRVVSLSHYMVVWLPCLHANWHFGGIFCRFWAKYYVSIQIYICSISLFVINWGGSLSCFNPSVRILVIFGTNRINVVLAEANSLEAYPWFLYHISGFQIMKLIHTLSTFF